MTPDPELDGLVDTFLASRRPPVEMVPIPVYRATDNIMADLKRRGIVLPGTAQNNR